MPKFSAVKVIGLIFALVMFVYIAFPAVGALYGINDVTHTDIEGDDGSIADIGVDYTVQNIDSETGEVTYELEEDNTTTTITIAEGNSEEVEMPGGEITVTVDEIDSDSVTTTFQYASTHGWAEGATGLLTVIGIFFMLGIGVLMAAPALKEM